MICVVTIFFHLSFFIHSLWLFFIIRVLALCWIIYIFIYCWLVHHCVMLATWQPYWICVFTSRRRKKKSAMLLEKIYFPAKKLQQVKSATTAICQDFLQLILCLDGGGWMVGRGTRGEEKGGACYFPALFGFCLFTPRPPRCWRVLPPPRGKQTCFCPPIRAPSAPQTFSSVYPPRTYRRYEVHP